MGYADDVASRWVEIDGSLKEGVLRVGVRVGLLSRQRDSMLTVALVVFGSRGVRNMEDYRLLALLARIHPGSTSATASSVVLGLSKAATAVRIERFERDGLVQRKVREFDRRTVEVSITSDGIVLARECTHAVVEVYSRITSVFDDSELEIFDRLLEKFDVGRHA